MKRAIIRLISIVVTALLLVPCPVYAWDQTWDEASQSGQNAANLVLPKVDSGDSITSRFSNPLTSSGSQLRTFDEAQGFTAQLTAPSSNAFLDLFIAPSGTGDLTTVNIRQDTDFDGSFDYAYSLTSPVSGVCANGFISADPGTWNNKRYYVWRADSNGRVTAVEVPSMTSLAGCYCINSSCGSSLVWANIGIVLKDLGGGIVSAIQQERTVTITSTQVNGTEILYYGQESSSMGNSSGVYFSGTPNPEQYFAGGGGTLPSDAEALNQASDPDSFYYRLSQLSQDVGSQATAIDCTLTRNMWLTELTLDDIIVPQDGTGQVRPCGIDCIEIVLGQEGDNYWSGSCTIYERHYNVFVNHPERISKATLVRAKWDDYMQVWIGGTKVWSGPNENFPPETGGPCELNTSWNQYPNLDVTDYFKVHGTVQTRVRVSVTGGGEGYAIVRVYVDTLCVLNESISDSCSSLESDPNCTLRDEEADGVYTYRDYNPTGLKPIPSCRTITGTNCTYTPCPVWWEIRRTYTCTDPNTFDFTAIRDRAGHIHNTWTEGSTNLTYQDYNPLTGEYTDYDVTLPPRVDVERCEKSCRVRVPVEDTQASLSGTTADYRDTINTFREVIKPCEDGSCPVGPGEVMIEDCACTSYFLRSATLLQVMNDAGKDIICSSSPP